MLLVGGTYLGIVDPVQRLIAHSVGAVVIGCWTLAAYRHPAFRPEAGLVLASLPALAAFALAVVMSERPRLSLEAGILGAGLAAAFFVLLGVCRNTDLRTRLGAHVSVFVAAIAVGYIVQVVVEWIAWWGIVGHFAVPPLRPSFVDLKLGSPNVVAAYLVLLGPLAALLVQRRFGLAVAAPLVVAMLIATLLTGSRGGWLGAGVAIAVLIALRARDWIGGLWDRSMVHGGKRERRVQVGALLLAGTAAVFVAVRLAASRLDFTDDIRSQFWSAAWKLFVEHPLIGVGPGAWPQVRLELGSTDQLNIAVAHAHNLLLNTLAEVGLAGTAGLLVLGAVLTRRLVRGLRAPGSGAGDAAAVSASLIGFGAHSMVDNLANLPAVVIILAFLVAWVVTSPPVVDVHPRDESRAAVGRAAAVVAAGVVAVLIAAIPATVNLDRAGLAAAQANGAANAGDWTAALTHYDEAVELDPELPLYHLLRGNALAHLGRTAEALDAYRRAVPDDLIPENRIALAVLEATEGDHVAAAVEAERAVSGGGATPVVSLNAGIVFERAAEVDRALAAYALAARSNPALLASTFWDERPAGLRRPDIAARVIEGFVAAGAWQEAAVAAAYAGDSALATEFLATAPPGPERAAVDEVVAWLAGDRAAAERLGAMLDEAPGDFFVAAWLARIRQAEGDLDGAAHYRRWALALRADQAPAIMFQFSVVPAPPAERPFARPVNYPDAIYQRPGPHDMLPPQVLAVGIESGRTISLAGWRGDHE